MKSKGYFVTLIIVDVPIEIAKERNKVRYMKTGRMVPESILMKTHQAIPSSYLALKDYVDEYYLYDTRNGKPVLIAEKNQENGEIIHESELLEEFLKKMN
ncbi:zeta toxin family protein [Bacillus atrophaeus]|uniref:zeta toxin family protein n=1 Tax=Bacillus atrophaeus TaxID=1452 RepID=UPI00227E76D9|nr:zeta toxin family protein [Bacillus atrophaeus]MEC0649267.1 zeta toxin family protein [Bacillus atrophaeus]